MINHQAAGAGSRSLSNLDQRIGHQVDQGVLKQQHFADGGQAGIRRAAKSAGR